MPDRTLLHELVDTLPEAAIPLAGRASAPPPSSRQLGRATLDGWVMRVGEMLIPVVQAVRRRLIRQNRLNPLEELPDDPGQDAASRQLPWRGLDQIRDGGEGVGHSAAQIIQNSRPLFGEHERPVNLQLAAPQTDNVLPTSEHFQQRSAN